VKAYKEYQGYWVTFLPELTILPSLYVEADNWGHAYILKQTTVSIGEKRPRWSGRSPGIVMAWSVLFMM